ncbi:MAG: hypothetical protein Q9187_000925 [Circinaria calcarea]
MTSLYIVWLSIAAAFLANYSSALTDCAVPFGPNITKYAVGFLPDITYKLPFSWAGEIPIPGTENDALFFWLFEAEKGARSEDLIIWLNGGPGCSSLQGAMSENGPLRFLENATKPAYNRYSWTKLANILYIDQPVGTGFSTGSADATDNAQVTQAFYQWLKAFYAVFPTLKSKNTYIMGESYAGIYIPYFAQDILENKAELPMNLKSITLGNPTFGNAAAMSDVVVDTYLHRQEQILDIPQDILSAFSQADNQCGFTEVLGHMTYPPSPGPIVIPGNPEGQNSALSRRQEGASNDSSCNVLSAPTTPAAINESIYGPCFGPCATFTTALNYLLANHQCFNVYNINSSCANHPNPVPVQNWLNKPAVRTALHAPPKNFTVCNATVQATLGVEVVTPPAYSIIPRILDQGIGVHIYSGDYDFLINHVGTELVIQNMTWNGHQGFQSPPNKPFIVDGEVAGNWGAERNLTYHRFLSAGHMVPSDQPAAAFAFVRDFVLGRCGYGSE